MKIFVLPSHTFVDKISGTDYARVIQPMKHLNGYEYEGTRFEVEVYNHAENKSFDWRDIFQEFDIIYFNYTSNDVGYAIMGTLAQKYGKKLVCDIDDDIFNTMPNNPAYPVFKKGSWGRTVVKAILGDVYHVTCTNSHLKHSLSFNADIPEEKISVLPNYIDLSLYNYRCKFKDRGYYKALHFGSSTHHVDLATEGFTEGLTRIMREYPNFTFTTIGANVPSFKMKFGMRYEVGFGDPDLMKWIKMQPEIMDDHDFMLVPLLNGVYNRSKSSIKYLEASSYKIPGVYQNIRQYQELVDGTNGILASTGEEWYRAIKTLIVEKDKRKSMGEGAFKTIQNWRIERHLDEYAKLFISLLTSD